MKQEGLDVLTLVIVQFEDFKGLGSVTFLIMGIIMAQFNWENTFKKGICPESNHVSNAGFITEGVISWSHKKKTIFSQ